SQPESHTNEQDRDQKSRLNRGFACSHGTLRFPRMGPIRVQIEKIVEQVQARSAEPEQHESNEAHEPWLELYFVREYQRKKEQEVLRPVMSTQCSHPCLQSWGLDSEDALYCGHSRGLTRQVRISYHIPAAGSFPNGQV